MKTLHFEVVPPGHSNSAKTLMIYLEMKLYILIHSTALDIILKNVQRFISRYLNSFNFMYASSNFLINP